MRSLPKYFGEEIADTTRAIRAIGHVENDPRLEEEVHTLQARRRSAIFKILWPAVVAGTLIVGGAIINSRKTSPVGDEQKVPGASWTHNFEPPMEPEAGDGGPPDDDETTGADGGPHGLTLKQRRELNEAGEIKLTSEESENFDNVKLVNVVAPSLNNGVNIILGNHPGGSERMREIYEYYREHAVPRLYTKEGKPIKSFSLDPKVFYFDMLKKGKGYKWLQEHGISYLDPRRKTVFMQDPLYESGDPPPGTRKYEASLQEVMRAASFLLALNDASNCASNNYGGRLVALNIQGAMGEVRDTLDKLAASFRRQALEYPHSKTAVTAKLLWDQTYKVAQIAYEPSAIESERAIKLRGKVAYLLARWVLADYDPETLRLQLQLIDIVNNPALIHP